MDAPVDLSKSPIPEVLAALTTDPHKGLDAKEAVKYGLVDRIVTGAAEID